MVIGMDGRGEVRLGTYVIDIDETGGGVRPSAE